MRRLREILLSLRDSFWVVPMLALLAAVLLGIALVEVDARVALDLGTRWPRLFGAGAAGARGTLTAIASSMITVAGVVFSVTIVALSLGANTYSPRVLRTFTRDRPTQAVFGVFVGAFGYCLVVLRTVRVAGDDGVAFVPSLAVFGALAFALAAVSVLVYFIHHVAMLIQVSTILERIAAETGAALDNLFPEALGEGEDEGAEPDLPPLEWRALPARRSGYIVSVDGEQLLDFARKRGALLRMELEVGEFAIESRPLASLAGGRGDAGADADALDSLYSLASERTVTQDAAFGFEQIVAVATRALSPGINDPGTAIMCIDRLTALLVRVARRRIPGRVRREAGEPRVIARGPNFESLAGLVFGRLAYHARDMPEVRQRLARAARIVEAAAPPRRRRCMQRHREALEAT